MILYSALEDGLSEEVYAEGLPLIGESFFSM
jgi:hypothetical protein